MLCKRQIAILFFLLLTVAVALPVAQAQARPGGLSDSQEPGSVLVFPIFETGTITTADQGVLPNTLIEVSAVCPKGATCPGGEDVDIHFDWVCPGNFTQQCADSNFTLHTTVHGTIRFDANGGPCFPGPSFVDNEGCGIPVAPPGCEEGYLIGWVVDGSDNPIKFDGLIGDAVLRETGEGTSGTAFNTAVTEYNAITIQASAALANLAPIYSVTPADSPGDLEFDGSHYQRVTGKIYGSVRLDNFSTNGASQRTYLALLTLDVKSNRLNRKIDVDLNFYNETEAPLSTNTHFFCFEETDSLSTINASLTSSFCSAGGAPADTYCKGEVESTKAVYDLTGAPVTLLGLAITREYDSSNNLLREYSSALSNDSTPVDTDFVP